MPRWPVQTVEERFWSHVEKTKLCWVWTAGLLHDGYANFALEAPGGPKSIRAHRFAYQSLVGPIPDHLETDHLCRVRFCVKVIADEHGPAHVELVTHTENVRRARNAQRAKTHCPQGHPYDEANTIWRPNSWRLCRICQTARRSRRHFREKALREAQS